MFCFSRLYNEGKVGKRIVYWNYVVHPTYLVERSVNGKCYTVMMDADSPPRLCSSDDSSDTIFNTLYFINYSHLPIQKISWWLLLYVQKFLNDGSNEKKVNQEEQPSPDLLLTGPAPGLLLTQISQTTQNHSNCSLL